MSEVFAGTGLVSIPARHSVEDVVCRLEKILLAKGVKLFTVIDHSSEAESIGLQLRNTKVLIFGSPKAGTPLMIAAPTLAIDLPLKILVWEDADAHVWLTYNSPDYLRTRHHVPTELIHPLEAVEQLAQAVSD